MATWPFIDDDTPRTTGSSRAAPVSGLDMHFPDAARAQHDTLHAHARQPERPRAPYPQAETAGLRDLTARGLTGARLVTSDAHSGLTAAGATLPGGRRYLGLDVLAKSRITLIDTTEEVALDTDLKVLSA